MEIWDAYNRDGEKTGADLIRSEKIPDGLYHLVCETVVMHTDGEYLLLKRDYNKEAFPGFWEIGAGGSALKGETPLDGAIRELFEESGIRVSPNPAADSADSLDHADSIDFAGLKSIYRIVNDSNHSIYCGFLCVTDALKDSIILQNGETISYKWVSKSALISFFDSDKCIPGQKDRLKAYIDSIRQD